MFSSTYMLLCAWCCSSTHGGVDLPMAKGIGLFWSHLHGDKKLRRRRKCSPNSCPQGGGRKGEVDMVAMSEGGVVSLPSLILNQYICIILFLPIPLPKPYFF